MLTALRRPNAPLVFEHGQPVVNRIAAGPVILLCLRVQALTKTYFQVDDGDGDDDVDDDDGDDDDDDDDRYGLD